MRPLTNLDGASQKDDASIGGQLNCGRSNLITPPGVLNAAAQAFSSIGLGVFLAPSQSFCDSKQSFSKTTINGRVSGGVWLTFSQEILETEIQRIHPELLGNKIRRRCIGPGNLNRAEPPESAGRDCIRINCIRKNFKVRDAVRTNGSICSLLSHTRSRVCIGPSIEINFTLSANQSSVASYAALNSDSSWMARYSFEALFNRLYQLDRSLSLPRQSHCNGFRLNREFATKGPTYKRDNNTHFATWQAKDVRKMFPERKRILCSCPNGYAVSFDISYRYVGLH